MSAPLIPERLKDRREALGLNKTNAARKIGLTQSGYVRYENGERKPTIQTIEAIAASLSTSVDYLIGKTDDPSPDRILILKKDDPVLFDISEKIKKLDDNTRKRLLAYYDTLTSTSSK